ncbi:unnamed protein product [Parnassius apollo]|uniref:(apollo) hypothetical protein n=1 Tax=Parnassius apollo TaxID=110799 RepID=A0A8S3WET6_PARAO|nr:unnamed protein product [Parnassius apollo]
MSNSVRNTDSTTEVELPTVTGRLQGYQDPPPPYSPVGMTNNQPIIHQTIIVQSPLKDRPTLFNCPTCKKVSLTKVKYANSTKTHMIAGFICGCTFWCMLCCLAAIPYLLPAFKKTEHYCPNCDRFLGTYSKL